jgi:putative FmdB family regulatory protein
MPIYLYRCRRCKHELELLRGINEKDTNLTCPKCGAKKLKRVVAPLYGNVGGTYRPT